MTVLEAQLAQFPHLSERTRTIYTEAIRDFISFAGRDRQKWTAGAAQRFYDSLLDTHKVSTANTKMKALRLVLPVARLVVLRVPTYEHVDPVSQHDLRKLVAACAGTRSIDLRDRALLLFVHATRLPRSVVVAVEIDDISGSTAQVATTKATQTVHLTPEAATAVDAWIKHLRGIGITTGPLFRTLTKTQNVGEGMSVNGAYLAMKARAAKAGLERFSLIALTRTGGDDVSQ